MNKLKIEINNAVYRFGKKPAGNLFLWFIWKLPRRVVYWSAIRVGANATTGSYGNQVVPDLTFIEALKRWDEKDGV